MSLCCINTDYVPKLQTEQFIHFVITHTFLTAWLNDEGWDNITELDKIKGFHGVIDSFEQYPKDWQQWYIDPQPEDQDLIGNKLFSSISTIVLNTIFIILQENGMMYAMNSNVYYL